MPVTLAKGKRPSTKKLRQNVTTKLPGRGEEKAESEKAETNWAGNFCRKRTRKSTKKKRGV
jgi:hypothetical protein